MRELGIMVAVLTIWIMPFVAAGQGDDAAVEGAAPDPASEVVGSIAVPEEIDMPPEPLVPVRPCGPRTGAGCPQHSSDYLCDEIEPFDQHCDKDGPQLQSSDYGYGIDVYASIGELVRQPIIPINADCSHDWKNIEFEVVGLPEGATLSVSREDATAEIRWRPERKDVGEHEATARVRAAGHPWSQMTVTFIVTEEWETFFMPGVQYSMLLPQAQGDFGTLHGVSIEYLIAGWIHRNENRGPSYGRFYADIDLLRSTTSENLSIAYSLGLNLSFERNPKRQFLIPYFGAEFGGIYFRPEDDDAIHAAQLNPLGGIHLWASQNLFINVTAGYMVPLSHIEALRGLRVKAGLNFSFW